MEEGISGERSLACIHSKFRALLVWGSLFMLVEEEGYRVRVGSHSVCILLSCILEGAIGRR